MCAELAARENVPGFENLVLQGGVEVELDGVASGGGGGDGSGVGRERRGLGWVESHGWRWGGRVSH